MNSHLIIATHFFSHFTFASGLFHNIVLLFLHISILSGVTLSLNGSYIPNHGYVAISDIGDSDDDSVGTALICHTNRIANFSVSYSEERKRFHSGGNWHAPNGTIVGDLDESTVPGFKRDRRPMMVRLHRNTGTPSEGIYYCVVEDDTFTEQTVYVGLYNSGGGGICKLITNW